MWGVTMRQELWPEGRSEGTTLKKGGLRSAIQKTRACACPLFPQTLPVKSGSPSTRPDSVIGGVRQRKRQDVSYHWGGRRGT